MSNAAGADITLSPIDRRVTSGAARVWRSLVRAKFPLFGIFVLLFLVFVAIGAPWLAPVDPNIISVEVRLLPPAYAAGGALAHPLGTDGLGRDVLSRLIYGARVSLIVGFAAVVIAGLLGSILGLVSGYLGGRVDDVIMRIGDIQLAFPFILLAISVMAVLQARRGALQDTSMLNRLLPLVLTLGITQWVTYARMARSVTLSLREQEFVEAARAVGVRTGTIIFRHIMPNAVTPVIVVASFNLAATILAEASLSFLGLGVPPSVPTWGGMLAESRELLIGGNWWLATIPGVAIVLTVLSINLLGDWLRDYLDPRLKV